MRYQIYEAKSVKYDAQQRMENMEMMCRFERGIEKMCEDLWRWQSMNPYGFGKGD